MIITRIFVGFAVCIFVLIVSGIIGAMLSYKADTDDPLSGPFLVSSIGFGICLMIILYQNGIFK